MTNICIPHLQPAEIHLYGMAVRRILCLLADAFNVEQQDASDTTNLSISVASYCFKVMHPSA